MQSDNRLTQLQIKRNANTVDSWETAELHRSHLTQLFTAHKNEANPTLCVLGAGNCNDLDLPQLTKTFAQVTLVDIDQTAVEQGVAKQGCTANKAIRIYGNCDVTGVWQQLAELSERNPEKIDKLITEAITWPGLSDLGNYGTVTSTCLLSQLIEGVLNTLKQSHPRCIEVVAGIRQRHWRLLYELTSPGGQAVLVSDFVSSDTAPTLPSLSGKALSQTLTHMISQHNFFTGLNPFRLQALLTEDDYFLGKIHSIRCEEPWLWNLGPRHYAVTAISFQRK